MRQTRCVSLTGMPFLLLVAALALIFTVAAIGDLPRLKLPRIFRRLVLVLGAEVFTVLLALVSLNNWGEFYGSWNDLFGGGSGEVSTITAQGASHVEGVPSTLALTSWSSKSELKTRGGVFAMTLHGSKSKLSSDALVFLPAKYFQSPNEKFPVVETIAGYPGNVPELVNRLGYPAALNKAIADGSAHPMILVLMRPTLVPPRDTECTDIPNGPKTFTFFSEDVPAILKKTLRVTDNGWGAMGHSTGGYCAAKLAMMAPAQFPVAVSLSGYFTPQEDDTTGSLYGGDEKIRQENDLLWRVKNMKTPNIALLASIGQDEKGAEGIDNNQAFITAVKPPMDAQLKVVADGGHNFATYQKVMPSAFSWLSEHTADAH